MSFSKKQKKSLLKKVMWEGGWEEFICGYGCNEEYLKRDFKIKDTELIILINNVRNSLTELDDYVKEDLSEEDLEDCEV